MQQLEALDELSGKLSPMKCEMALNETCGAAEDTVTADKLEIYQQLIRFQTVTRVLEESKATDFMVVL
jgi:hypothetical protein